ncbi:NAD-dependent protein deacylase sirtuin-5, mitochondrial [Verticillium nonalfalfae]|uniref:NAD-dependent protein deacylase sirtuin-5, mitochondrial n=1 Tax=Verticillium nonalfalfae TaxID=1051616 RepID=A0A3M9Y3P7_9PEZI|nr:NAD-dependent protein deacylase sirtuin-5, mitochondrial [Verticillium nonalfalfae]RNJ53770.1 NAD-dependent protein deacylase sirtuin-5, mitochondrial [Verticillium nonalfalfae]
MSSDLAAFHALLTSLHTPRILALCGAGLSASSGLPTFRGAGGLWRRHDATRLATPEAFAADPALVWLFYAYRRHMALAALARAAPGFLCLTQNVDGLSQRAGHPAAQLRALHGNLFGLRCSGNDHDSRAGSGETQQQQQQQQQGCGYHEEENLADPLVPALAPASADAAPGQTLPLLDAAHALPSIGRDALPSCPRCSSLLRPGVVWFGEALDDAVLDSIDGWIEAEMVDLVLVVGTSARVFPAAAYVELGRARGARVCVVDLEVGRDRRDDVDFVFEGDAAVLLPRMLAPLIGPLED